ncbi:MAG: galactitol-1-phosphate 5-dehydrogenase [Lachnospiraceae bacterium]|nr:galactitol-1-phosphate 5-dehydrogenase [Lachnospiraceae bacterium]
MRAYSLIAINNLEYIETDIPNCKEGWAIVKVKASGICSSDIPRVFETGTYHFPTIPGHEFAGIVEKVGSIDDLKLVGKHVGVFPLIPCKKCLQCKQGHYEMCSDYDYLGSRRDGGFAEYVAVPVWNLIEINEQIKFEEAAMLEPLSVALHAIKNCSLKNSDRVAIVGTGMIGFAAAQWAKVYGVKDVTVIGRSKGKKILADRISVNYCVMNSLDDEFDVVIEAVGSNKAVDLSIKLVRPYGTLVLMGNPEADIVLAQNTYWRILRKQLHLVGTWNSAYEKGKKCDWSEAIEAIENHRIDVSGFISHVFDQSQLKKGLDLMHGHTEPYCKVMTMWNTEDK